MKLSIKIHNSYIHTSDISHVSYQFLMADGRQMILRIYLIWNPLSSHRINGQCDIFGKNKNKNTFISEKKYNIIIIFIMYVTYNSFLETAIMGTAAQHVGYQNASFINHFMPLLFKICITF